MFAPEALPRAISLDDFDILLPDGPAHAHVLQRVTESDGHEVIRFAIGDAVSTVTIANGIVLAHIWSEALREYVVRRGPAGYVTRPVTDADFKCQVLNPPWKSSRPLSAGATAAAPAPPRRRAVAHEPQAEISVLLLRVAGELPSLSDDEARLEFAHAIDLMNTALINSGLSWIHFYSVGVDQVAMPPEVESSGCPLGWLADSANVPVATLRQRYHADLVTLDAQRAQLGCASRPFPGHASPSEGFVFTTLLGGYDASGGDQDYAMETLHEWGHALGGDHNPEDESIPAAQDPAPYARCFYHCGAGAWRGPLSYGTHCGGTPEDWACTTYCNPLAPRYPIFSNPEIIFRGIPAGVPDRQDNARAFALIAPAVARYVP